MPVARRAAVAYTAMHGVGVDDEPRRRSRRPGFAAGARVAEQDEPDPDFPTVAFPNPEEPGAIDLLLALAERIGADVRSPRTRTRTGARWSATAGS